MRKRVLIYSTALQGSQESLQLDEAIEQYKKGNEVYFIHCDGSIGGCNDNPKFNKGICRVCVAYQKKLMRRNLPSDIVCLGIRDILPPDYKKPSGMMFRYEDCIQLQDITYKGVEIGMGCMSTYISLTRNMHPKITDTSRKYFNRLLESQVVLTDAINNFLNFHDIDLIVFHNGRYAQYKPLLNIAEQRNIEYLCTESQRDSQGNILKNYFFNTIPHNITVNTAKFHAIWEDADPDTREEIGKAFFKRKRGKLATGDKIYTANQIDGLLVDNWDRKKDNIVIFNSSEDEYCAIGKEFESRKFFKSQLEGIKTIMDHYSQDSSKHFYLRIHPNLKNIPFRYHTDLYSLDYPNLTVIPGDSPISTYSLIDNADKIITFGSTVGAEAAYSNKPVINLGPSLYNELDITYIPRGIDNLWELIDSSDLQGKYNGNVIKYGYYYMALYNSQILERCRNIDNTPVFYKFFGKRYFVYSYQKLLGSNFIYMVARGVVKRLLALLYNNFVIPRQEVD